MGRHHYHIAILALSLLALAACSPLAQASPRHFDPLVRWVPGDAEQVFFLDFKPADEAGESWARIRARLESKPGGQDALESLYSQFRINEYSLQEFMAGPAVGGYGSQVNYTVAQVSDENGLREALLAQSKEEGWQQAEYEGHTLYYGRIQSPSLPEENLAWTIHDGFLLLASSQGREPLGQIKTLLSLSEGDSLAALPAWKSLRARLPARPMGLMFLNVAENVRRMPPSSGDESLGSALNRQLIAVALAAVPEVGGMRVEIVGDVALQADASPEMRASFGLPAVDANAWPDLPADTAIALVAHDASTVWPWFEELFNLEALVQFRDQLGLDLRADLAGSQGPLTGDFAMGVTPPLSEQPISGDVPAIQLLILGRDVGEERMSSVRAAMEGRGATFGREEVEGIALQTQVGTRASGYAISYGFEGGSLLFGSSPEIIGKAAAARRAGGGLVAGETFRAVLTALPSEPSLVLYLNNGPLTGLLRTNTTEERYQQSPENRMLEAFDAIGLGLQLTPDEIKGVLYFAVPE